tara:strand:+ start:435 stop:1934 length:1500 start_codon:yes stop_codon:yes gene_type:complete
MDITAFNIDTTPMSSTVNNTRAYSVVGNPGAMFNLIVQNDDNFYYNFPENTISNVNSGVSTPSAAFSSTPQSLVNQEIPESGIYEGIVEFPAIADDDYYTLTISKAGTFTDLSLEFFKNNNVFTTQKIYSYINTQTKFSITHSNSVVQEPAQYVASGRSSQISRASINRVIDVDWVFKLSSSLCSVIRQPLATDFEFTTTKTTLSSNDQTGENVYIELTDITGLSKGMLVNDSEIPSGSTIVKIFSGYRDYGRSTSLNHIYNTPLMSNDDGTALINSKAGTILISAPSSWAAGHDLTFVGQGPFAAEIFNNTRFSLSNFKIVINDTVTTTTAAVPDQTIHVASAVGIKALDEFTVDGAVTASATIIVDQAVTGVCIGQRLQVASAGDLIGIPTVTSVNNSTKQITLSSPQTFPDGTTLKFSNSIVKGIGVDNSIKDPFVISINGTDVVVNANQNIESGGIVTFIGSSQQGKITGQINILEYGDNEIGLDLNFDNILRIG